MNLKKFSKNKKSKLSNFEKRFLAFESFFVFGILIYLFFSTAPSQIYPLSGMTISEANFVFEIENGEEILISTDKNFTNPIVLGENSEITLSPGTYYWKVRSNFRESEVKEFTIQGHVGLEIEEKEKNYSLENSGNVDLNVTKENNGLVEEIILDVGEKTEAPKDNSTYTGVQK